MHDSPGFPALLALLLWACGAGSPESLSVTTRELESPAGGELSGEPFLHASDAGAYLSWLELGEQGYALRFSRWDGAAWSEARTIAQDVPLLVNWADFPGITPGPDGALWAHWLERAEGSAVAYGVAIAHSTDGGQTWSAARVPHEDDTQTEHGFVAALATGGAMGFAWLDGRRYAQDEQGQTELRFRTAAPEGFAGPETVLDERVCDCCQTDAALTDAGPIVVYRDRSDDEIRDVYATRWRDGAWTPGEPVHRDGWRIEGCPVNGPAVAARGKQVAVAWFTAAQSQPRVKLALSADGGDSFGEALRVDDGNPVGRVDVQLGVDGSAWVTWLEGGSEGEGARVRLKRVRPGGAPSAAVDLTLSSEDQTSGFPRLAAIPGGPLLLAWTDARGEDPRVRVQRIDPDP